MRATVPPLVVPVIELLTASPAKEVRVTEPALMEPELERALAVVLTEKREPVAVLLPVMSTVAAVLLVSVTETEPVELRFSSAAEVSAIETPPEPEETVN